MPSPQLTPAELHALLHEKLDALIAESEQVMDSAKHGRTFHDLDDFFCTKGHEFLQEIFNQKLQERIEKTETTPEGKQCPHCKKKTTVQEKRPITLVAVHGHITVHHRYRYCSHCDKYCFPIDTTFGLETGYTERLQRIVTRCCGLWSYRLAADTVKELCGANLSHTTMGKIAGHTADEIAFRLQNNPDVRNDFQKALGETEFYADGVFVHIRNEFGKAEWREFKVGAFAKRVRSLYAFPSEWATRKLPDPSLVSAFAALVDKDGFQELCQTMRRTLGVGGVTSTLGDGAKWIWNVALDVFGKTDECLDIYHGAEYISDCSKVLFSDSSASKEWFERMRMVLLSEGLAGLERELSLLSGLSEKEQSSVDALLEYFRGNAGRLNYAKRLSLGRAIGSGLIEGACKNLVGRRLKQTGACWRLERANKIAVVASVLYSDQWHYCW